MTQEEKLQLAKEWYNNPSTTEEVKAHLEELFPELKESEDGRIKKFIISHLQGHLDTCKRFVSDGMFPPFSGTEIKMFEASIAWLKKQGNISPTEDKNNNKVLSKFTFDDVLALQCCVNKVQEDEDLYEQLKSLHDKVHDYYWFEKQGKQTITCSEKYIADVFEKVGLAKIVREQANDELTCAVQDVMIELSKFISQQNITWSEEDERNLEGIINEIEANKNKAPDYDLATYDRFLSWLKSFKDRVQPQPKPSWSEEDKLNFYQAIYVCHQHGYSGVETWLKSLKDRYSWKPTDEQIIALRWALNNIPYCRHKEEISGLLDQIKNL